MSDYCVTPSCAYTLTYGASNGFTALRHIVAANLLWLLNEGYLTLDMSDSQTLIFSRTGKELSCAKPRPFEFAALHARSMLEELGLDKEGDKYYVTASAGLSDMGRCRKIVSRMEAPLHDQHLMQPLPSRVEKLTTRLTLVSGLAFCLLFVRPFWLALFVFAIGSGLFYKLVARRLPSRKKYRQARAGALSRLNKICEDYEQGRMSAVDFLPYSVAMATYVPGDDPLPCLYDDAWDARPSWYVGRWPDKPAGAIRHVTLLVNTLCKKPRSSRQSEPLDPRDVIEVGDGTLERFGRSFGPED